MDTEGRLHHLFASHKVKLAMRMEIFEVHFSTEHLLFLVAKC